MSSKGEFVTKPAKKRKKLGKLWSKNSKRKWTSAVLLQKSIGKRRLITKKV
jgi:hypothetical protein